MSIDFIKSLYYEFLSYFIPQKVKYRVEGECLKCGKCCKEIRAYGMKNEKDLIIMQFFIPHYRRFFISKIDEKGDVVLSCKHLTENGLCGVYNKRPNVCKNYPAKTINFNGEMIEGCGYKVIKKQFKDYLYNQPKLF